MCWQATFPPLKYLFNPLISDLSRLAAVRQWWGKGTLDMLRSFLSLVSMFHWTGFDRIYSSSSHASILLLSLPPLVPFVTSYAPLRKDLAYLTFSVTCPPHRFRHQRLNKHWQAQTASSHCLKPRRSEHLNVVDDHKYYHRCSHVDVVMCEWSWDSRLISPLPQMI